MNQIGVFSLTELVPFEDFIQLKTVDDSRISIIIAAYNEEEGIVPTISEFIDVLKDANVIVVDGKSSDKTVQLAENLGAQIFFQEAQGKGDAMSEGLKHLSRQTEYVVFTDADYTYSARPLRKMIKILDQNSKVGMVLGNRFNKIYKSESDRNEFYLGNKILAMIHNLFNGLRLNDPFTGLRIIRYDLLKDWTPKSNGFDIEAEINCHVNQMRYEIVEMPIKYRKRLGEKKLGFRHGFEILRRIILKILL